jgi:hypothetical protein
VGDHPGATGHQGRYEGVRGMKRSSPGFGLCVRQHMKAGMSKAEAEKTCLSVPSVGGKSKTKRKPRRK